MFVWEDFVKKRYSSDLLIEAGVTPDSVIIRFCELMRKCYQSNIETGFQIAVFVNTYDSNICSASMQYLGHRFGVIPAINGFFQSNHKRAQQSI